MVHVVVSQEIHRPADDVFAYVADFENNPRWQRGMREASWTSEPPVEVGSTYEQVASFLGREIRTTFVVRGYEPGSRVTIESIDGPFPLLITRRVEPMGAGRCRVEADVRGDPSGFFRLAGPVLGWLVRRSVRSDYRRLKRILE